MKTIHKYYVVIELATSFEYETESSDPEAGAMLLHEEITKMKLPGAVVGYRVAAEVHKNATNISS